MFGVSVLLLFVLVGLPGIDWSQVITTETVTYMIKNLPWAILVIVVLGFGAKWADRMINTIIDGNRDMIKAINIKLDGMTEVDAVTLSETRLARADIRRLEAKWERHTGGTSHAKQQ